MATATQFEIDCALMAGAVYKSSRNEKNILPNPNGWETFNHKTTESGFEAVSFRKGNEIVISFAGSSGTSLRDIKDWVTNFEKYWGRFYLIEKIFNKLCSLNLPHFNLIPLFRTKYDNE